MQLNRQLGYGYPRGQKTVHLAEATTQDTYFSITHVHFYKEYVDANLDASDNVISGSESTSEMLTRQSEIPE